MRVRGRGRWRKPVRALLRSNLDRRRKRSCGNNQDGDYLEHLPKTSQAKLLLQRQPMAQVFVMTEAPVRCRMFSRSRKEATQQRHNRHEPLLACLAPESSGRSKRRLSLGTSTVSAESLVSPISTHVCERRRRRMHCCGSNMNKADKEAEPKKGGG